MDTSIKTINAQSQSLKAQTVQTRNTSYGHVYQWKENHNSSSRGGTSRAREKLMSRICVPKILSHRRLMILLHQSQRLMNWAEISPVCRSCTLLVPVQYKRKDERTCEGPFLTRRRKNASRCLTAVKHDTAHQQIRGRCQLTLRRHSTHLCKMQTCRHCS